MSRPLLSAALVPTALVAASCTSQPVILPSQDFARPTDIAFVCMGTFGENVVTETGAAPSDGGTAADAGDGGAGAATAPAAPVSMDEGDAGAPSGAQLLSGRPMRECHPRGTVDVKDNVHHTFAFLPNSAAGSLSVIDADTWSLVNLDPANSGYNALPLGVLPSQIAASDDGCRLVTANHGSCDLSFVDPAALLAPTVARDIQASVTSAGTTAVTNVVPRAKNSGRELRVLAGEVSFLPMATADRTSNENLCSGAADHQWQALATFPSCDLVALIDLPSGVIQKAAYTRKAPDGGVTLVPLADDEDPVCPVDCLFPPASDASAPDGSPAAPGPDGGAPDAGAPPQTEAGVAEAGAPAVPPAPVDPGDVPYVGPGALRPGPIAIIPDSNRALSNRAFVGLANAAFVLAFNVGPDQLVPDPSGGAIPLHEGALGVDRVRLSIDPFKDKVAGSGVSGSFVGDDPALDANQANRQFVLDRQYLYVVARDGTLRVVQVAHQPETECETNVDFTAFPEGTARTNAMNQACPSVVGPSIRLPSATGPGIRLPTPPIDIAVADIRPQPADNSETSVSGAHAWVLTASGNVYLVNIDPVTRFISAIVAVPQSDGTVVGQALTCDTPTPGMCLQEPDPAPNTVRNRGFVGFTPSLDPSTGPARLDLPPAQSTIGPRLEGIWTLGSAANATSVTTDFLQTYVFFPDPSTVTAQSWFVSWEGDLMANPRLTGQLIADSTTGSVTLQDIGMDFCRLGTQVNDLVTLEGCTTDAQCGINKVCVLGSNGAVGAGGFPIQGLCLSPTTDHTKCDDLLSTIRRYDVTSAHQSVLALSPHKDELVRPTLKPCVITSPPSTPSPGSDGGTDAGRDASSGTKDAGADGATDAGTDALSSLVPESDCVDPADPSTANFQCIAGRCLYPCDNNNQTAGCRAGRICLLEGGPRPVPPPRGSLAAKGMPDPEICHTQACYCSDGPRLESQQAKITECLGELLPYQVGVGRGFAVTGSGTPLPATGIADASGACVPFPDLDPRVRVRIPMDAPRCATPAGDNDLDSRCDPNLADPQCPMLDDNPTLANRQAAAQITAGKLLAIAQTKNDPNPCMFFGGPNETDLPNTLPEHVHALYRNRDVQFMMSNLERPPTGVFQLRFDVHGGFQPQFVTIPSTVEVTMPARIVIGPFDANNPLTGTPGAATAEVPYLFVVDQRRLGRAQGGGPTRGQLLRIHPRGFAVTVPVAGNQPWFEDLTNSANLFPIQ